MARGVYCLIIRLNNDKRIQIGRLGSIYFKKGCYCYIGSALNNLEKRIERHKRKSKKLKWHIDYFLNYGKIADVIKIKTGRRIECLLSRKIDKLTDKKIRNFGCSDCSCYSHLYYFKTNPSKLIKGNLYKKRIPMLYYNEPK